MSTNKSSRRPGDLILDRYLPNATEAQREEARENLKALMAALVRIDERLAQEAVDKAIRLKADNSIDSGGADAPPL